MGAEGEYGRYRAGLTGFYTEVENLIESVFQRSEGSGRNLRNLFQYQNIAEATLKGIEAEVGALLPQGFSLDANLTWLEADDKTRGGDLGGMPKYKAFLKLAYERLDWQLRGNLRMSYVGETTYADDTQYSYPLFGAYLNKGFGENLALFAGVDNIFDKRIQRNDVVMIEPATFYVGVTAQF